MWRHRVIGSLLAMVILGAAAGCTSGGASTAPAPGAGPTSGAGAPASASAPASATAGSAAAASGAGLAAPGCSAATAAGPRLSSAGTATLPTTGDPFGLAVTPDGRWAFAVSSEATSVEVFRLGNGTASAPAVTAVRTISLVSPTVSSLLGGTITPNGKYLLVAEGSGALVVSVADAEAGAPDLVLGALTVPARAQGQGGAPGSAIEVAVSADSRFAFVTLEYMDEAVVFNLAGAIAHGFGASDYVGAIPLGNAPVGLAVSPDGRWLYATSEGTVGGQRPVGLGSPGTCDGAVPSTVKGEPPGTLTVISLPRAETDPARSVTVTVDAGYQPVRVVTAADGTQVWVTARASDDVLCFSAERLASDPSRALTAVARVGSEPVGLEAVRGGTLLVVADSNRFGASGENSALTVVSVAAALAGRPAVLGNLVTGLFPRDMALSSDGTLLVSDFSASQVQAVNTARLPE
ncbi:MAG TPA: hypothetical protein VGG83_08405 [Trebonia sp.]